MTNKLDEKIRQDLTQQSKELDALLDNGLGTYFKLGFAQQFAWLTKISYVLAIILSLLIFFCGYKFFTADTANQLFWGICLMLSFNAQIATKQWIFMVTNRNITSRELRQMELRLQARGD